MRRPYTLSGTRRPGSTSPHASASRAPGAARCVQPPHICVEWGSVFIIECYFHILWHSSSTKYRRDAEKSSGTSSLRGACSFSEDALPWKRLCRNSRQRRVAVSHMCFQFTNTQHSDITLSAAVIIRVGLSLYDNTH